ncbi:LLM class oxidoreductase [Alcaligenes nematophilus]|uniref:LLM class oxidoreductase n=1 Tax=Alcaligenes nematophilus TaxID=2994643 RepID=A0ABU3MVV8_9BURK|nr:MULTISPECIES: LLM class oxidoreductase [Alcaligenes]MDH4866327.1 LLM class oxidoreductase [Bacillus cereus]MCB4324116.1 LLM class oxidoreductase [Alcaligenes sp. 13f]MDT8464871.1 LLM class oxidoreductase [Alcaligenes nematophilus]MDT8468663.1 LLM class oxidoreductase [Alcaligenes nematophilus]MDT8504444.1 LLM class oxidoreductase [Alcaligenes nematophilus]
MTIETSLIQGASFPTFATHPGYSRMFAPGRLTMGIFLPLRFYQGDMSVLAGQAALVEEIDRQDFAAVWVRDVPLYDPSFGDAGQVFDPFTYLAFLAARTRRVALATGSTIFSLRHPIDLAKSAFTIDQLSGGRLVLGIASGDRPIEFPAYGVERAERAERFAHAVSYFRQLMQAGQLNIDSPLGRFNTAELLPKPAHGSIPLIVTSSSGQSPEWIAEHADGWLTYPEATHTPLGPQKLAAKIQAWRARIPDGGFRPHMTNEWLDLVDDPDYPRTPLQGGFTLRTGRKGLITLLEEWQAAGVNHAALGIQFAQRPAAEIIQELAEYVLPHFASHQEQPALATAW